MTDDLEQIHLSRATAERLRGLYLMRPNTKSSQPSQTNRRTFFLDGRLKRVDFSTALPSQRTWQRSMSEQEEQRASMASCASSAGGGRMSRVSSVRRSSNNSEAPTPPAEEPGAEPDAKEDDPPRPLALAQDSRNGSGEPTENRVSLPLRRVEEAQAQQQQRVQQPQPPHSGGQIRSRVVRMSEWPGKDVPRASGVSMREGSVVTILRMRRSSI